MTIADMIQVLQAAERGEEIETRVRDMSSQWAVTSSPCWDFNHCDYRIKPKPRMVPLEPSDVPPGSFIRSSSNHWFCVTFCRYQGLSICSRDNITWEELHKLWEISRDGGRTWSRCEKEAK